MLKERLGSGRTSSRVALKRASGTVEAPEPLAGDARRERPIGPTVPARKLLVALKAQHRRMVRLMAELAKADRSLQADRGCLLLQELMDRWARHVDIEERFLFPAFERQTGLLAEGPTAGLRRDHRALQGRLERLAAQWSTGGGRAFLEGTLRSAQVLLDVHFGREELTLGIICGRQLDASGCRDALGAILGADGGAHTEPPPSTRTGP